MRILVLGAGRMGLGAVYDLAHNAGDVDSITVADIDGGRALAVAETVGSPKVNPVQIDVADHERVVDLMTGHDSTLSCVVYTTNLQLARAAIKARSNFCDLGGNNTIVDSELALDAEAKAAGINIIPDCGLAPGMVSVLAAHAARRFDAVDSLHIRVGGLPLNPQPPLFYQIVFSVEGLINEYIEPARVIRDGRIVEIPSMTEIEALSFPSPYDNMEAFQTSGGTSTLPETFLGRIRELDYKTIRFPGHCEQFKLLTDLGFASSDPVDIDGALVKPRRVLGELLLRHLPADGPDVVLVRLDMFGTVENKQKHLRYDIIDRFDESTGLSSMMRTTAFPASIVAQMMARGDIKERGAIPQERCVPPEQFVRELDRRNIQITESLVDLA